MAEVAQPHQIRPWYKRPPVWVVFVVLAALAVFGAMQIGGGPATIRYSDFLDQLDAGNVASVAFSGTRIDGHFKQPVAVTGPTNGLPLTLFRSHVPDFGDPTLLPALRNKHVAIGVGSSQWVGTGVVAILGVIGAFILAKPMLLVIAAALIVGLIKVAFGGKMDIRAILSMLPMFRSMSSESGKQEGSAGDKPRIGNHPVPMDDEMADTAHHHCSRAWYLRPPVWILGLILVGLAVFGVVEVTNKPAAVPYSDFLAQLDAGNVASVTFKGTQVDGNFKRPVTQAAAEGTEAQTIFRSKVPDFGDPTLLPELRKERVVVDVVSSSNWASWLGRLPWPLVLIIGAMLIVGLVRFLRGNKAPTGSARPTHPIVGMITGLFSKKNQEAGHPESDATKAPPSASGR